MPTFRTESPTRTRERRAHRIMALLAALIGLAASGAASATLYTWPGAAPCDTTLQACITAAADGDTIYIATNSPINNPISIDGKGLTIAAASGYKPTFANHQRIMIDTSGANGNPTVQIFGLTLPDGYINASLNSSGTTTFVARGVHADSMNISAFDGNVNVDLSDNYLRNSFLGAAAIDLYSVIDDFNAEVYFNHIDLRGNTTEVREGIAAQIRHGSGNTVKLFGNTVRGERYTGIEVTVTSDVPTPADLTAVVSDNVVMCSADSSTSTIGIRVEPYSANLHAQVVNNTVTSCDTGIEADYDDVGSPPPSLDGTISNNLLVSPQGYGVSINGPFATTIAHDYNLINASVPIYGPSLGSHTITAPAKLLSATIPRPSADSPAIDAGDTATAQAGITTYGLPSLDADGLRRFKGAGNAVDIGAYEYGDFSVMHTASANSNSYISFINNPLTNNDPSRDLFATPTVNPDGMVSVANDNPFGVYYSTSEWALFLQDTGVGMPASAHYGIFLPGSGAGRFQHVATSANTSNGWDTVLDDPSVNDQPDEIVLATQNWSLGTHEYNAHPIGVFYLAFGGPGKWLIANLDGSNIPIGAGFNVYAQPPSPNAFRVSAIAGTSAIALDHPLLNNTPCAQASVTRIYNTDDTTHNFNLQYLAPYWYIVSHGRPFDGGEQFNVLVNPRQVALCTDVIFADGFDDN